MGMQLLMWLRKARWLLTLACYELQKNALINDWPWGFLQALTGKTLIVAFPGPGFPPAKHACSAIFWVRYAGVLVEPNWHG